MPTGYTAPVVDGTITELRDFALLCVRAFGVAIDMRDEPLSTPFPDRFKPDTAYHDERLIEARARLAELQAMTPADRAAAAALSNAKAKADHAERTANDILKRLRYDNMLRKVEGWKAGYPELRKFMLEQLEQSRDFDIGFADKTPPVDLTPEQWFRQELDHATHDIGYHEQRRAEVIARTAERNAWLEDLRASLDTITPNAE